MILEQLTVPPNGPADDFWYGDVVQRTRAGVDVDEKTAMNYSVCWAATRLLAGTSAALPLNLMKSRPGGGSDLRDDKRLHTLLHDAPNPEMSSMMWRSTEFAQQINWGNCYNEIERDGAGEILNLWPIHASRVTLRQRSDTAELVYVVKNDKGGETQLKYADVFHVPSVISDDGRVGKGVIRNARESIGHAIATERYGGSWFGNGGRLSGVLEHPNKMDREARANLRREWNEIYHDPNAPQKTAVLWEGMKYTAIGSTPEDSQFLESRQFAVEDIARWYGVPPHLIGHLLRSTFNNIEHQGIEFVKYSLLQWLKLWEQEIWRKLLTDKERKQGYYAKFVVDGLERGDLTSRTAALAQQFFNGAITLNQWAELEDREPIGPLGEMHFIQSSMVPLEIAAEGPQEPAAPGQPAGEPDKKEDEPADDTQEKKEAAITAATFDVLSDIVEVMLDRESQAAIQAAKKPAEFLSWLDKFYADHATRLQKALARPIRACVLASGEPLIVDETIRLSVAAHVEASRNALLDAAGGKPESFASDVEKCVTGWKRTEIADLLRKGSKYEQI